MSVIISIIMIVVYPLNSFLAFPGSWALGKENVDDAEMIGQVKGVEIEKKNEQETKKESEGRAKSSLNNIFSTANFQPVRNDGVADLVIPDAHASLILDADSGTILHYANGKQRRQIASLTKLMTAVVVMENVNNLDEEVTIDEEAVYIIGTKIGCPRSGYCMSQRLVVGEKISVLNLLKAMLMNSANDAATALGKHIGGTQENFVIMMNKRAKELGLMDSNFCTPSGLERDGEEESCYSSAYDIARIAAHSLKFKELWDIARLPSNTIIKSVDGKIEHVILNTDLVIDEMPNLVGCKTGFTPLAGQSLLMAVQDESKKHTIIAVLLSDPYRWQDIKIMANWAFSSYKWQ